MTQRTRRTKRGGRKSLTVLGFRVANSAQNTTFHVTRIVKTIVQNNIEGLLLATDNFSNNSYGFKQGDSAQTT